MKNGKPKTNNAEIILWRESLILGFRFSVFHSSLPPCVTRIICYLLKVSLLATLAVVLGCQRERPMNLAPVEGTVTMAGKPLANVIVVFWGDPENSAHTPLSSGFTDAAGHYRLHTDQGDDGAIVGRHRVCILEGGIFRNGHAPNGERHTRPNPKDSSTPSQVPLTYAYKDLTTLQADVRPGEQVIDLAVK